MNTGQLGGKRLAGTSCQPLTSSLYDLGCNLHVIPWPAAYMDRPHNFLNLHQHGNAHSYRGWTIVDISKRYLLLAGGCCLLVSKANLRILDLRT